MPDPKKKALTQAKKDYESKGTIKGKDPNRKRPTGAKKRPYNVPGGKPKKPTFGKKAPRGVDGAVKMKASPEKKATGAVMGLTKEQYEKAKATVNKRRKSKGLAPVNIPYESRGQKDVAEKAINEAASKGINKGGKNYKFDSDGNVIQMKASPEKKAAAKAKAIKGGMPANVANRVFKMSMGSKSLKNSDSAFSMYSENVMRMSPLFAHDPSHPASPRTTLHSYDETNTNVKRSGGGNESSNVQKKSTSNLADYQKGLKDLGPDFKPTAAQTAAANKKVAELKKKDAQNAEFNKNISKSNKSSVEKSVNKKTTVLGKQTQAEILAKGKELKKNRKSRIQAERGAIMDKSQADSIKVAQAKIKQFSKKGKLNERMLGAAHLEGQRAGRETLRTARGKGGEVLFSPQEIGQMYNSKSGQRIKALKNPNKRESKRNPKVTVGYHGAGSLGERPKLSDLQMNIGDKALKYYNRKK